MSRVASTLLVVLALACTPEVESDFEWLGPVDDASFGPVTRVTRDVRIRRDMGPAAIESLLRDATDLLYREHRADAAIVYGRRDNGLLVGRGVRAPDGRWENARAGGPARTVVVMESVEEADKAIRCMASRGDTVIIAGARARQLSLYADSWQDEDIVGELEPGEAAVVTFDSIQTMANHVFIRYLVSVPGREQSGWIHGWDIEPPTENCR